MKIDITTKNDKRPVFVDLDETQVNVFCSFLHVSTGHLRAFLEHIIRPVVEKLIEEAANK